MVQSVIKKLLLFISPVILLSIAVISAPFLKSLPVAKHELFEMFPYLAAGLGALLSIQFHRGRSLIAIIMLSGYYWAARNLMTPELHAVNERSIFNILSFVIPFNLLLLSIMREKGIFSSAGIMRLLIFTAEGMICIIMYTRYNLSSLPNLITISNPESFLLKIILSQPAILFFIIVSSAILLTASIRQTPLEIGLFGASISFFISLNWHHTPDITTVFSTAGIFIMTAAVLQNSYNMAFLDELTGIPSRRALNEYLHGVGSQYAIAMCDVDHFKRFNDTYGHDVGDQVLKMVAKRLKAVSGGGKAFRYGGEEFTIVFPRKNRAEVLEHLEQTRKEIADYRMLLRDSDRPSTKKDGKLRRGEGRGKDCVSVTISMGVSDSESGRASSTDALKMADKALYKAKERGRNQVCS